MKRPILVVVTGPNGAGKSTISENLLERYNIKAFDFDFTFNERWSRFGYDPTIEAEIWENTQKDFEDHLQKGFDTKSNLSFETNFHTEAVMEHVRRAKSLGYETKLIFIGLENVSMAKERVEQRVKEGGHHVHDSTIEERFNIGLNLLDKHWGEFDKATIYESLLEHEIKKCLLLDDRGIKVKNVPSFVAKLPRLNLLIQREQRKNKGLGQ